MIEYRCEPLAKGHDRQRFRCGVPELDEWLQQRARQDLDRRAAAVYVMSPVDDPARIAGFYTLSATSVLLTDLPKESAKRLPRYPAVPAILLGRLARDVEFPGVGELLLMDALSRAWRYSTEIAAAVVVVDAKNEIARTFYRRHGFEALQGMPRRLFLSLAAIKKLFEDAES